MNTETFAMEFGSMINSKIDVNGICTRKEAWNAYFDIMLEKPVLLKSMPESEMVALTMQTVFRNVDWVN